MERTERIALLHGLLTRCRYGLSNDRLMREAQIALTPGRDFGRADPERWLRLSFASSDAVLREALARLKALLQP